MYQFSRELTSMLITTRLWPSLVILAVVNQVSFALLNASTIPSQVSFFSMEMTCRILTCAGTTSRNLRSYSKSQPSSLQPSKKTSCMVLTSKVWPISRSLRSLKWLSIKQAASLCATKNYSLTESTQSSVRKVKLSQEDKSRESPSLEL